MTSITKSQLPNGKFKHYYYIEHFGDCIVVKEVLDQRGDTIARVRCIVARHWMNLSPAEQFQVIERLDLRIPDGEVGRDAA